MKILTCKKCKIYTLKEKCPKCNKKTQTIKPAKFSPKDTFGKYRRKAKDELQNRKS